MLKKPDADATAVSKSMLVAILVDHGSTLKPLLVELRGKLDELQQAVNSHNYRLASLEQNAWSLHHRMEGIEDS